MPTRAIDILIASAMLLFFAPLMLIVAAAIRASGRGPILTAHRHLGRGGRSFPRFTFRTTMAGLGPLLRQSSLDELPQLFNILRGEMSIVGPRPIVEDEVDRYGRYLQHYGAVKPGVTGLWQLSGRGDSGYRRRVAMDIAYARNKSPLLDLRILLLTIPAVMLGRGC